jgi:alpha-ketoglutarate-dependent taurine dioxygenase
MTTTTVGTQAISVAPLSGTIGAEIRGVDLHGPLEEVVRADIRRALLDYKVIFFPGQHLGPVEHKAFAEAFGELTNAHPVIPGIAEHREVFEIDYTKARELRRERTEEYGVGEQWHTDVTFVNTPPLGSILNAVVIPAAGGDTVFADTQAAYEGLSEPLRRFVDGLSAVHDGRPAFGKLLKIVGQGEWDGEPYTKLDPVEHPVVRTHPETGRKNLFVNPGFTSKIVGLSRRESDAVLALLYEHMTRQEYLVRYSWDEGDLGFWDNRTTMHYAVMDYGDAHRVIQRVTLRGDKPV